jgi:predicted transglutaminase-like cysteine proteinase
MSKLSRAPRATALSAVLLCLGVFLGLLSGAASAQAGDPDAPSPNPYQIHGVTLASADPFEVLPSTPQPLEPFGAALSAPLMGGLHTKWSMVKKKLPAQHRALMRCRAGAASCPVAAKRFQAILDRALAQQGWARIAEINRTINLNIKPVDDMTQYGVSDLWATPLMTFSSGAGDCEDYAIAKYVALQEIGIAEDDLRLVVIHDRDSNVDHAVTAVRYDGSWLILDNRTLEIRHDAELAEFEPMFAIDREGVKRMTAAAPKPASVMVSASPVAADVPFASAWQTTPLLL